MNEDRLGDLVPCLELGEQLVEIMDVPRPFDLGQHDDVHLVADLRDDLDHVVERPRTIQAINARPQPRGAIVVIARHLDETTTRSLLVTDRDCVLEVAKDDIHLGDHLAEFGLDLLVVRRHEMDHALEFWTGRAR